MTKTMTGAFTLFLNKYSNIKTFIDNTYLGRGKNLGDNNISKKNLHKKFVDFCRKEGIKNDQYPLITNDRGKRALERYVKNLEKQHFSQGAKRYGDSALNLANSTGIGEKNDPVTRPFQRVEFDGHKIDLMMAIKIKNPDGTEDVQITDRIWLLSIIDEATKLILGYHICIRKEYSSEDVLRCIKNAVVPKEDFHFMIPGLKISPTGGFHSSKFEQCKWAVWDELLYDNAKANLAEIVKDRLINVVNCSVNAGPVATPVRRPFIERFFGILEVNGFHRLPNTTGSNPNDPKRQNAKEAAIAFECTEMELEELVEVLIAEYNGEPNTSLNFISPLDAMDQYILKGGPIRFLEESKRNEATFYQIQAKRTVVGSIKTGRRPYINFENAVYKNEVLSQSAWLIGTELNLLVNIDDLRVIRAYLPDGSELGFLQAQGRWGIRKHSLKTRKEIFKLKKKKLIHFTDQDDPIEIFLTYLEKNAKNSRKARNELAAQKRDLRKEYLGKVEQTPPKPPETTLNHLPQRQAQNTKREPTTRKFFKTYNY
ncbi:hypothetical protein J7E63_14555 [Bacillus sp. ISL-75]|uniref:hypothetical protein n=1 Tax=Bacillus sp. ISL-75 TaxID=2819137 RepID=UPI001BECFD30|nr:hypothetical protein [Bacillus sp. ISL-75]MBT2728159.1 hypothetical protein [Bacillus sp. ISL-75]